MKWRALASRIKCAITFAPPAVPHNVGLDFYRKKSSWGLKPDVCPCDVEFAEFLHTSGISGKVVLHFGTGSHHVVATENYKSKNPNQLVGLTASLPEHQAYVDMTTRDRAFAKHYTVLYKDIYTLAADMLPQFDVISLFHLCEFYFPEEAANVNHDDASLLAMFVSKLNPGGKVLFYTGSFGWQKGQHIVQDFVDRGILEKSSNYKHLLVYQKTAQH